VITHAYRKHTVDPQFSPEMTLFLSQTTNGPASVDVHAGIPAGGIRGLAPVPTGDDLVLVQPGNRPAGVDISFVIAQAERGVLAADTEPRTGKTMPAVLPFEDMSPDPC
jgi:hypothetical protein